MNNGERSRLSRAEAKHKPHRTEDRFFSAKSDAKTACEELTAVIRRSAIHDVMKQDLLSAVERAQGQITAITPTVSHPGAELRELTKQVQHLQVAENWVAAADRVLARLNGSGPVPVRAAVEEAQDTVMWCVRADEWNGQLTAAVSALEKAVKEAEVHASRLAG